MSENKKMDWKKVIKERRGKVGYIPREAILHCFTNIKKYSCVRVINFSLPEHWLLRDVHYEPLRDAFAFFIFSGEFPPVEEGLCYPELLDMEEYAVRTETGFSLNTE